MLGPRRRGQNELFTLTVWVSWRTTDRRWGRASCLHLAFREAASRRRRLRSMGRGPCSTVARPKVGSAWHFRIQVSETKLPLTGAPPEQFTKLRNLTGEG